MLLEEAALKEEVQEYLKSTPNPLKTDVTIFKNKNEIVVPTWHVVISW